MFRLSQSGGYTTRAAKSSYAFLIAAVCFSLFCTALAATDDLDKQTNDLPTVLVVLGAPGDEDYASKFNEWAGHWEEATKQAGGKWLLLGDAKEASTNEAQELRALLDKEPKPSSGAFWLVL